MQHWQWWLFLIVPACIGMIFGVLFLLVKRHRGSGYILSKFSAFTRIRFDRLEQKRQTYCPADGNCHCHAQTSAAHIEPNLACRHRASTLYMSFAGAAMIVGGVRTTEWRGSMKELHGGRTDQFDALFFTDPAQCFYLQDPNYHWQGIAYYRHLVQLYSTLYERVILIGASLGGSMVCMCADLATLSIAFNPILDPTLLGLAWRLMGAFCPARQAQVVRDQVQATMEKIQAEQRCVLHVHWSEASVSDQRQAYRITGGRDHDNSLPRKYLSSVSAFDVNDQRMSSTAGVHVWFHQCARHALAMHLKRAGQLIPLLRQHLTATSTDSKAIDSQREEKQRSAGSLLHKALVNTFAEPSDNHEIRLELF